MKSLIFRNKDMLFAFTSQKCPDCHGRVILWRWPSRWAGIYECLNENCASTWSCKHPNYHVETGENWPISPEDTSVSTYEVYVCNNCGVALEDLDPVLDRLEAAAEL